MNTIVNLCKRALITQSVTPILTRRSYYYMGPKRMFSSQKQVVDPEIPHDQLVKMQNALKAFSQCITMGRYRQAQEVLDLHKKDIDFYFPEKEHPAHYSCMNNQALLFKLKGDFVVAKELFEQVLQSYDSIYGQFHPSTCNALINLATVHKDLHEYEESIPYYEKAIETREKLEGADSLNYAMAKAMAAGSYRELGKFDIADHKIYLKDAYLKVALEFGEENISAAVILNSMGILSNKIFQKMLYKKQRKHERSLDAYLRALTVRETQLGEDHPDCIATRHNIAELYLQWAKPDLAGEYLQKNIQIMEKRNEQDKKAAEHQEKDEGVKQKEGSYF